MQRILVTGGAGFIGSHLCERLLNHGHIVHCLDNFDRFYSSKIKEQNISLLLNEPNFQLFNLDIRDIDSLLNIMPGKYDLIIHLAAKAGVRPSLENPFECNDVNVSGTLNLLEYARKNNITKFIFGSSSSVYGINENSPWREDEELFPISPYASSKISGEMYGKVYSSLYGIRFIALRFFTVFGPRQRPDLAIYKFFNSIYTESPITIFGDGLTCRDYTYVDDIVSGIVNATKYEETLFEVFNLGNNKTTSLQLLIRKIEEVSQKKAVLNFTNEQPGDVPLTSANIDKAKKLLGYQPSTTIEDGLTVFNRWFQDNYNKRMFYD